MRILGFCCSPACHAVVRRVHFAVFVARSGAQHIIFDLSNAKNVPSVSKLNTSQTFTKHIRWDKIDYSKMKGLTPDDRSPRLQRLQNLN